MNRKCENCKSAVQIVNPSIYKCKRDGTTKMFNDTCLYFTEIPVNKQENNNDVEYLKDIFGIKK